MASKQIDVTCPCCSARITVDVLTRQVLRHVTAEEQDDTGRSKPNPARWDSAQERVRERTSRPDEVLDDALSGERERRSSLDDLFSQASDKVKKRGKGLGDEEE